MANSFKIEIDLDLTNVRAVVVEPKNGACKLIFDDGSEINAECKMSKTDSAPTQKPKKA
ncbi:MAG: hypothetical protein RR416_04030 [Clostridia bacterium]